MAERTGADAVYETLRALGVDRVFGIVSIHNIPIYDAILRGGGLTCVDARHEQGAVHMADGFARATGRLGVAIASTGPGTTNAVTGLYEADYASSRVLLITGQAETAFYGKGKGYVHEHERQLPMLRTVTKRAASVRTADEISTKILEVARDIHTGRPGSGAVEIPVDLQTATVTKPIASVPDEWPRVRPNAVDLARAAELVAGARRRLVWAGGGVVASGAASELTGLAEALDAPVFTSANGRGAIPEDHPLSLGPLTQSPELRGLFEDAEVLLAVGTRFQAGPMARNLQLRIPCPLIHIDVDPRVVDLHYPTATAVIGDAKLALAGLLEQLPTDNGGDVGFLRHTQEARDEARASIRAQIGPDHEAVMDCMRACLPRDAVIVRDSTVPAYLWANRLLPILEPSTSITPTSGAIGPGLPLAIGAAMGSGKKTVVIHGDGGFMLHIGELATAAQYRPPLVICVFNDRGYGVLRWLQAAQFQGRTTGVDLATPDFAAVARGMGLEGEKVAGVEGFKEAFARAVAAEGPMLLDIDLASLAEMEWPGVSPPRRS